MRDGLFTEESRRRVPTRLFFCSRTSHGPVLRVSFFSLPGFGTPEFLAYLQPLSPHLFSLPIFFPHSQCPNPSLHLPSPTTSPLPPPMAPPFPHPLTHDISPPPPSPAPTPPPPPASPLISSSPHPPSQAPPSPPLPIHQPPYPNHSIPTPSPLYPLPHHASVDTRAGFSSGNQPQRADPPRIGM